MSAGADFLKRVRESFADPNLGTELILRQIAALLDTIERLEHAVESEGVTVAGSNGQPRTNPHLAEIRASRLAVSRLLASLSPPDSSRAGSALARASHASRRS